MAIINREPKVSITLYGDDAAHVRRVAALLPLSTVNAIGAEAVRVGLASVEAQLRAAARAIVDGDEEPTP